jgi:DNA-binding beta-propeller fold protein YncE
MTPTLKACVVAAAAALLASCSTLSESELARHSAGDGGRSDRLLVRTRSGLAVMDAATQTTVARAPQSVVAPGASRLLSVSGKGNSARVVTLDSATGRELATAAAPAGLRPGVASADGALLAFSPPHEEGVTPWLPKGKARTRIAVVRADGSSAPATYNLKGNFELEGFSTSGSQLFLLEYKPAMNPTHYGLKRLLLDSGKVRQISGRKQNAPGRMRGTGRIAAFSPSGHELYTLYTQQGPNYAHGSATHESGRSYAFVHLLNLEGGWTHCIDLRAPFGTGRVTTHAMALSPNGDRLFVADPSSGGLAVISPLETKVLKSVTLDLRALTQGRASAAATQDGTLYLAGGKEILVVDGDTLEIRARWSTGRNVTGIALGSDGRRLYASQRGRVVVFDAVDGNRTGAFDLSPGERILDVVAGP